MSRFKEILTEELKSIPANMLSYLPTGFQQIGNKAVINLKPEIINYQKDISKVILRRFTPIKGVYLKKGGVSGQFRTPDIGYIMGEKDPIVTHKEHGITFKFDITKIMFAKGNVNERFRFSQLVTENEIVFDLFSGIGYFSLIIGKYSNPKKIYSFEMNPISYDFLVENIKLNKINKDRQVIETILGDSNETMLKIKEKADRVIMGMIPAPKSHIKNVFKIINKKKAMIHYEGLLKSGEPPDLLLNDIKEHADIQKRTVNLLNTNIVKSYGPNVNHVTLDIEIV